MNIFLFVSDIAVLGIISSDKSFSTHLLFGPILEDILIIKVTDNQ